MTGGMEHDFRGDVVLVVDDDPLVRWYTEAILQTANLKVIVAGDGLQALDIFYTWRASIDLVITDIRMPLMSGTDLAISLRSANPALPLIFISGEPAPQSNKMPPGGTLFIEKPFTPRVLLDAVHRLLNATRLPEITFKRA